MAIAFNVLTEGGEDTDNTTFTTASVSPAAGSIVLLTVMNFENSTTQPAIGSISGCGLTWTLVREQAVDDAGSDRATAHIWVGTGTPSTGTITVTWAGGATIRRPCWIVTEVTGADTASPIVQTAGVTASGSGTSDNVSFASAFADSVNNATFALYGVQNSGGTDFTTVDANLTKLAWESISFSHQTIAYKIGEEANVSGSWPSGRYGIAICEIAADAGVPPNEGTASGTYAFGGTAAGERMPKGSSSGGYALAGSSTGARSSLGTTAGTYTFSGTAVGGHPGAGPNTGGASGTVSWTGTAVGEHVARGTVAGSFVFAGTATGAHPVYLFTPPTYEQTFIQFSPALGRGPRYHLDQGVSIVRVNGVLRVLRSPSPTQLRAAGAEGEDWFIGGHIYSVSAETLAELTAGGFA